MGAHIFDLRSLGLDKVSGNLRLWLRVEVARKKLWMLHALTAEHCCDLLSELSKLRRQCVTYVVDSDAAHRVQRHQL